MYEWTPYAIASGYRTRLTGEFDVLAIAADGYVTAMGGGPLGSSGYLVNCPIAYRFL